MRKLTKLWPLGVVLASLVPAAAQASTGTTSASIDMALWEMIRASGLIAYVLLSVSVFFGIAVGVRALDWLMKRAWVYEGHQTVSALALAFTGLHVLLLVSNNHVPFTLREALVPFASTWRTVPVALGTLAMYLVALLVLTSHLRQHIGWKAWRAIHFGGFAAWFMALGHGVFAGSDTATFWVQYIYLASGCAVGLLLVFRMLTAGSKRPVRGPAPENAPRQAIATVPSSLQPTQ